MTTDGEKKWFALTITVDFDVTEAIESALNELDSLGTEIYSLDKQKTGNIEVIGYFNEKPSDENLQNQLTEALRIYGFERDSIKKTEWREVENQDWLAEWKKHWKPTETGKFIIAPPWETIENTEKIVIKIEPNMAFGTGTHETTRLCLWAIEENYLPEMSFFDLGTGTGILAVGAAKIQGESQKAESKIVGCDTDFDSIKIAKENAELNDTGQIDFYVGSISDETPQFDFVCANVTADVIVPFLPVLVKKTVRILVLSGILTEQETLVTEKLRELKMEDFTVKTDGEWIGIIVNLNSKK